MARTLSNELLLARALLAQAGSWLLFAEVELLAGQTARLVRNPVNITANGLVWQASNFALSAHEESGDGQLADLEVSVSNVSRLPIEWVEVQDAILGRYITFWIAHTDKLDTFDESLRFVYLVKECVATDITATFRCGHPAEVSRVPAKVFTRQLFPQIKRAPPR
ncbi:MAG: hypothetical protein AB7H92_18885 [Microbacteriaceae bacterium]